MKGETDMSDREKEIMTTIIEGLPKMSEFEKGYVLGMIESKANDKEKEEHEIKNTE